VPTKMRRVDLAVSKPVHVESLTVELRNAGIADPVVSVLQLESVRLYGLHPDNEDTARAVVAAHESPDTVRVQVDVEPDLGVLTDEILRLPGVDFVRLSRAADDPKDVLATVNVGADLNVVRSAVLAHSPDPMKPVRLQVIEAADWLAKDAIHDGFTYRGKTFSLSERAQITRTAMRQAKDALSYPVVVNTIDDDDTLELVNAAELESFCDAAVLAVRAALDQARRHKDDMRAATDVAGLRSVLDAIPKRAGRKPGRHDL